jgi:ribosomal protein S8
MPFIYNILTKIRNGASAQSDFILYSIPVGGVPVKAFAVLTLLRKIGIIRGFYYNEQNSHGKNQTNFIVYLKYDAIGKSVIDTSFFVSKPSRRTYISASAL